MSPVSLLVRLRWNKFELLREWTWLPEFSIDEIEVLCKQMEDQRPKIKDHGAVRRHAAIT